jgi:hypothetical protein
VAHLLLAAPDDRRRINQFGSALIPNLEAAAAEARKTWPQFATSIEFSMEASTESPCATMAQQCAM